VKKINEGKSLVTTTVREGGGGACGLGAVSLSFPPLTRWRQQHLFFQPKTASLSGWQAQGVQYGPRRQPGRLSSASAALKLKADALLRYLRQAGRLELAGPYGRLKNNEVTNYIFANKNYI